MSRSTDQRTKANRLNAQHSTGPRTEEGKAVSSLNPLTHGLDAKRTVLPGENLEDFQTLVSDLVQEFRPTSALQRSLVRQLADAEWRLRRVPGLEAGLLTRRLNKAHTWVEKYPEDGPADPTELEPWLRGEVLINDAAGADPLSKLSRYESRLTRNYFKALEHLRALQAPQASNRPTAPRLATPKQRTRKKKI